MKHRILQLVVVLALISLVVLAWIYWPLPRPRIVISRKTTYLTEPANPDGTIDYLAVVEEILKKGVTPENNAAPLLLRAVGPRCIEEEVRPLVLEALGLAGLPEEGEYFVPLRDHAESRGVEIRRPVRRRGAQVRPERERIRSLQRREEPRRRWGKRRGRRGHRLPGRLGLPPFLRRKEAQTIRGTGRRHPGGMALVGSPCVPIFLCVRPSTFVSARSILEIPGQGP